MDKLETRYCSACALKAFADWKGVPHKDVLPLLPRLVGGKCQRCAGTQSIVSGDIAWLDHHGKEGTGSGSGTGSGYWSLGEPAHANGRGLPYFSEMRCPKCQQRSIVSEMNLADGTTEYKCNCQLCGVLDIT
jgi:hypothetical protein